MRVLKPRGENLLPQQDVVVYRLQPSAGIVVLALKA
jgi:hypothetical protein